LLAVEGLATDTGLADISLHVGAGEIVGLIGLVGSGRTELARAIFGADVLKAGTIRIDGALYEKPAPRRSIARGLVLVPEDRRHQGLVLSQRVRANMALPHLGAIGRLGLLNEAEEKRRAKKFIDHFGVHPAAVDGDVAFYSGGNQQKVLLSKWIFSGPRVVILDEPSRGVDIGARRRIHEVIVEIAAAGAAVLLISSELEEVMGLSHRGYLMSAGRIFGEIDPRETDVANVLARLFHVSVPKASGAV
jgi:ABC-type sugar transport system ATPase subunit